MATDDQVVLELLLKNEREILRTLRLVQKALDKMGDEADDADKEVKKLDRTSRKLSGRARQTGRALRAYGDAFSGINSRAGRAVRTVGRLVTVFSTLGAGASASTLALGGVLAGFVALGAGVAAVGREIANLSKELPETQKGFQAVGVAGRQAGVAIAKELAPELNQVFRFATAAALAIEDYSSAIAGFLAAASGFGFLTNIFGSLEQIDFVQRYLAEADKLIARQVIITKKSKEQLAAERLLAKQRTVGIQLYDIELDAQSDLRTEAENLRIAYQRQADAASRAAIDAELGADAASSAILAINERFERELTALAKQQALERAQAQLQSAEMSFSAIASLSSNLNEAIVSSGGEASLALFHIEKSAAIARATVATALAVTQSLANPVQAVAIGLTGAGQIAAIAAQPPPQISQKHIGSGMIGARDPLAPDERMGGNTRTLTGERNTPGGMLNRTAAQNVNDMNAGRIPTSGVQYVPVPWKHLDRVQDDSARSGTSRFARALRSRKRNRDPQRGW